MRHKHYGRGFSCFPCVWQRVNAFPFYGSDPVRRYCCSRRLLKLATLDTAREWEEYPHCLAYPYLFRLGAGGRREHAGCPRSLRERFLKVGELCSTCEY